ncbi:MAG: hypothetical protein MI861_28925, partial [Pirellulales bacterium]|nr:hypothetical protein [Pirellulales bacterium]
IDIMEQLYFDVPEVPPASESADDGAAPIRIVAERSSDRIDVSVPLDGHVIYEVDGFPMRLETGTDGQPSGTCDEAEEQINQIHDLLFDRFGIEMDELMWEGKDPDPDRIHKDAEELPRSSDISRVDSVDPRS